MKRPSSQRLQVCGGFDGSVTNDHTAIRLETIDAWQFTPSYGPSRLPTIWDPTLWDGKIPRGEVDLAVHHIFETYDVERFYFDPPYWETDIERWALEFGDERVLKWDTGRGQTRIPAVHAALERYLTDLNSGALTHDGCPITAAHMANARKIGKPGDRYILDKPNDDQKIDAAVTSVICHEAASDARAAGWAVRTPSRMVVRR